MTSSENGPAQASSGRRSPPEATALLVELGRAVKGREFYQANDPEQQLVLARAVRVWIGELERGGALEIRAEPGGIRVPAITHKVPRVHLGRLVERLLERGIRELRFERDLEPEAFAALVEFLAAEPAEPAGSSVGAGEHAVERALYTRVPHGVVVNGVGSAALLAEPPAPAPEAPPEVAPARPPRPTARPLRAEGPRSDALPAPPVPPPRRATAPAPADLAPHGYEEELELHDSLDEPALEIDSLDEIDSDRTPELSEPALDTTDSTDTDAVDGARADEAPGPSVDSDTDTDVHAGFDGRTAQLRQLLSEIEDCDDDLQYNDLVRRATTLAEVLSDEGDAELGYRTLALLARHAGDDGKRTTRQRQLAHEHLEMLARGARVEDLIERSCCADPGRSLAATQLLLRIGQPIVRALFTSADQERDPSRRGELQGILIAMGEALLPELERAMEAEDAGTVRSAIRLAGESQNPGAVDRLDGFLIHGPPGLRQEAAKALVRIGDARAIEALARALEHPEDDVPSLAAYCLGATPSGRAVEALLGALHQALEGNQWEFAAEVIRSLGRLGRPEASRDLADVLLHRGMRHRRPYRELKLAAAAALGRIPGDGAAGALSQAATGRDPQLRRAAQTALDRRGRHLAD